ncbi:MAG: family 10 glycosylhydrolase, partial [Candidatus Sericytochromatia bacterium]|nr:family 10 glycosylhydrolase [Candidatus Sericytochromatia bacterium]
PWIWTFRIKSPLYEDSFFKKYPELIARRGTYKFEDREPLFLSPAEPKARTLILRMLRTMAIDYKIDGLLLDYIRYDETLGDDLLTKKYFREYFINKYHQEPPINIKKDSPFFNEFQLWREEQVTIMVKAVKRQLTNINPEIKIGAAIFRTEREGRLLKMQDWRHWSNNQYINFLCPMLYTDNNKELNEWINSETDNNTRFDYIYPSLGAHRFYSADDFYHEVGLLHQRNIPGMNIFSLLHLGVENLPDLAHGIFRKPAYLPEKSTINSVKLILSDTENWLRKISKLESLSGFGKIKNIIYKIVQTNSGLHPNNKDQYNVNELKKEISDIKKYTQSANKNENIPELLIPEIIEPLDYILRLIEIDSHKKETKNDYFPSTSPSTIKR